MLGILITLLVIAGVAYCVLKNYYPPIILLLAGFVMLICAARERNHAGGRRKVDALLWI